MQEASLTLTHFLYVSFVLKAVFCLHFQVGNAFQTGSQGRRELEAMASKPVSDYVFSVTNFNFLSQLLKQLEEKIFAIEGESLNRIC